MRKVSPQLAQADNQESSRGDSLGMVDIQSRGLHFSLHVARPRPVMLLDQPAQSHMSILGVVPTRILTPPA